MNDAGTATGTATAFDAAGVNAGAGRIRWDASGVLGFAGGGTVNAANEAGTAVGISTARHNNVLYYRAVRWSPGSTTSTVLGTLGDNPVSDAWVTAVNLAGTAVGSGYVYDSSGSWKGERAVRWDAEGAAAMELQNPHEGAYQGNGLFDMCVASSINSAGT